MPARLQEHEDRARRLAEALQAMDVTQFDLWSDLDKLSTHTYLDAVDVPVEGIVIEADGQWSAILNLYLLLQYGRDDEEGFSQSESFLAKVSGHLDGDDPVVDRSSVDTSSFYT